MPDLLERGAEEHRMPVDGTPVLRRERLDLLRGEIPVRRRKIEPEFDRTSHRCQSSFGRIIARRRWPRDTGRLRGCYAATFYPEYGPSARAAAAAPRRMSRPRRTWYWFAPDGILGATEIAEDGRRASRRFNSQTEAPRLPVVGGDGKRSYLLVPRIAARFNVPRSCVDHGRARPHRNRRAAHMATEARQTCATGCVNATRC